MKLKKAALWAFGKLVSSRIGFAIIKAYAFRTPHAHLYDKDGSLYMGRWHVVDEGTVGGRLLQKLTGYASIRLHHINRADRDRDLHNHPFNYRTFICKGYYSEQYEDGVELASKVGGYWRLPSDGDGAGSIAPHSRARASGTRFVHAGGTATGSHDKYHRIDLVSLGGVWTLFCMDANTETWGFKVDHKFVESRRYFLRNGYERDTIRATQTR